MTIETDVRGLLAADATVSGLVGARIYPTHLPQNPTYPAITFAKVSGPRMQNLAGPTGRAMPRLSIHCFAATYVAAKAVADAVRQVLGDFNGSFGATRATIRIDNEFDAYDDTVQKDRVIQDYLLSHTEA